MLISKADEGEPPIPQLGCIDGVFDLLLEALLLRQDCEHVSAKQLEAGIGEHTAWVFLCPPLPMLRPAWKLSALMESSMAMPSQRLSLVALMVLYSASLLY